MVYVASLEMTQRAAANGLQFRFDLIRGGQTFDAHRLPHLAKDHQLQPQMKELLLHATFTKVSRSPASPPSCA